MHVVEYYIGFSIWQKCLLMLKELERTSYNSFTGTIYTSCDMFILLSGRFLICFKEMKGIFKQRVKKHNSGSEI